MIGQYRVLAHRGHGDDAAIEAGKGCHGESRAAVVRVDDRPAPDAGHMAARLDIGFGHGGAARRAGNFNSGRGNRDLLRG